jgi:hypothetical protein
VGRYLELLESEGYAPDQLLWRFMGSGADNGPGNVLTSEAVRGWNAAWEWPKLRTATASEAFRNLLDAAGGRERLPRLEGEWADWWIGPSNSNFWWLGQEARRRLTSAESLAALAHLSREERAANWEALAAETRRNLRRFDEHSEGNCRAGNPHCGANRNTAPSRTRDTPRQPSCSKTRWRLWQSVPAGMRSTIWAR